MRTRLLVIAVIVALSAVSVSAQFRVGRRIKTGTSSGQGVSCTPDLSTGSHPRMFVNTCTRSEILAKINDSGPQHTPFQQAITQLESDWASLDSCGTAECNHHDFALALVWQLYDDLSGFTITKTKPEYLSEYIAVMDHHSLLTIYTYESWKIGAGIDLAWTGLNDTQRSNYMIFMATIDASGGKCTDPPQAPGNSQYAVCWAGQLTGAIAGLNEATVINDATTSTWVTHNYNLYDEKFRDATGTTAYESFFTSAMGSGECGGDPFQGMSYVGYTTEAIAPAEEAWRTAHGISRTTHYGAATADFFRCFVRTYSGYILPWEEGTGTYQVFSSFRLMPRAPATEATYGNMMHYVQGFYEGVNDTITKLAKWFEANRTGTIATGVTSRRYGMQQAIFGSSAAITAESPATQGLATHWHAGTSRFFFRYDWTSADQCWVTLEAQKWMRIQDERPRNPGGLAMGCNGLMSFYAGDESNSYSTNGWPGAASGMCFPDRSVDGPASANDDEGCIRRNANNLTATTDFTTNGTQDQIATIRESLSSDGSGISYVGQDLLRSYDSSTVSDLTYNRNRISAYWQDVFVVTVSGKAYAWVQSRVTVADSTKDTPTEIVMLPNAATIDGSATANSPVRNPTTCPSTWDGNLQCDTGALGTGQTTYAGAANISATSTANGASGAFFVKVLLPASAQIIRAGGPDNLGNSYDNSGIFSNEGTDLYGVRRQQTSLTGGAIQKNYMPPYRAEITETTPGSSATFFTTREIANSSAASQSTTTLYANGAGGDDFNCARVGSYAACAGEDGISKTSGDAIFSEATTLTVKWCGLNPSTTRTFTFGTNITSIDGDTDGSYSEASDAAGCVNLTIVIGTGGSGANNTITVS